MSVNVFKIKPKDHVIFRCGGFAEVLEIKRNPKHGDVDIIFKGEASAHNYLQNGSDYEHGPSLFDIVEIAKK